jgi:hypothetical protein
MQAAVEVPAEGIVPEGLLYNMLMSRSRDLK